MNTKNIRSEITKTFAYKAEWLNQDMFNLYTEPTYFPEITGSENCLLIGGRGTGKTTVLKGLSYQGQSQLTDVSTNEWDYYGIYYKIDSNRVSAFTGSNFKNEEWIRPFSHYINLIIVTYTLDFLIWYCKKNKINKFNIDTQFWCNFAESLSIEGFDSLISLNKKVNSKMKLFENYVNNIAQHKDYSFSLLGAPIDDLFNAIGDNDIFKDKKFYILLDEYENFSNYQQQVLNTLIKEAAGKLYCFKVGVREMGWRNKLTLNDQELRSPSDYRKIDIKEQMKSNFRDFAEKICNARLKKLSEHYNKILNIKELLPSMSIEQEAEYLGVKANVKKLEISKQYREAIPQKHDLFWWFLSMWAKDHKMTLDNVISDYIKNQQDWEERYENYKYQTLFTIKLGKRGVRKLYCGWNTIVLLSSTNIRFVLQLVETSLIEQLNTGNELDNPISEELQTIAAIKVSKNNFDEIEGLDVNGHQMMQLVQGLGRIFEVFAKSLVYAPESNSFWFSEEVDLKSDSEIKVHKIINACISHLALQRNISNKLGDDDPRAYDYSLHPIFSPLFSFSHRKKRKIKLSNADVVQLINNQSKAVPSIISNFGKTRKFISKESKKDNPNNNGGQFSLF